MAFVNDYLTPVIKITVLIGVIVWLLYIVYWVLNKILKNLRLFVKYKILRKKYDENIVEWCLKANELDYTVDKVRELLIVYGHAPDKVEEICYIYREIRKLRGGLAKDEQRIRESNLKTLPNI